MNDIAAEIAALDQMATGDLAERYAELHGQPCRTRHRAYLIRKVAWRIQANAEGDLSERARKRAAELADDAEVDAERRRRLAEQRTTPLSWGNMPGSNCKDDPARTAGDRYTTASYRRAIARACDQAFLPPPPLAKRKGETDAKWQARLTDAEKSQLSAWRKAHRWHPHQLRHNAATELRKEFGLEAARIILGHHSAAVTEIYAEKDEQQAVDAMMKVG